MSFCRKYFFGVALILFFAVLRPQPVQAQWVTVMGSEFQVDNKYLIVGDRIDVTFKAFTGGPDSKPFTGDKKGRLTIRNPKPGQTCETVDDNFKDDGLLKGYCEAKGDSGNMEIGLSVDNPPEFDFDGKKYQFLFVKNYNAMFNDPSQVCLEADKAPTNLTFVKQNDVTVDVKWQHSDKFVGSYDVLYGTTAGVYPSKKQTEQMSVVIDGLDPNKEYFFKIQANSACKTKTVSAVYKFVPKTGSASITVEKPAAKVATATASVKSKSSASSAARIAASPVVTATDQPNEVPGDDQVSEKSPAEKSNVSRALNTLREGAASILAIGSGVVVFLLKATGLKN